MVQSFKSYVWSAVKLACAWCMSIEEAGFQHWQRRRQLDKARANSGGKKPNDLLGGVAVALA